jgi:hypothetical protein
VAYAAFHLLDDVQLWFHPAYMNHFTQLINACFGPPLTDSPINELPLLGCTGTMDEYCNQFMALSCLQTFSNVVQQIQLLAVAH